MSTLLLMSALPKIYSISQEMAFSCSDRVYIGVLWLSRAFRRSLILISNPLLLSSKQAIWGKTYTNYPLLGAERLIQNEIQGTPKASI